MRKILKSTHFFQFECDKYSTLLVLTKTILIHCSKYPKMKLSHQNLKISIHISISRYFRYLYKSVFKSVNGPVEGLIKAIFEMVANSSNPGSKLGFEITAKI